MALHLLETRQNPSVDRTVRNETKNNRHQARWSPIISRIDACIVSVEQQE